jgi:hypothetical protein
MADFKRPTAAPVAPPPVRRAGAASSDDLLERATAILTEETSYLSDPAAASTPAGPFRAIGLDVAAWPGSLPASPADLEQLRQQASDVIGKLLAAASGSWTQPATAWTFPWKTSDKAAHPGDSASVPLIVDNPGDHPVTLLLYSTDLVSDAGYQIPAALISFDPPSQTIAPRSQGAARMNVAIPLQALAGSYSALVQAAGLAASKAVVTLDVL